MMPFRSSMAVAVLIIVFLVFSVEQTSGSTQSDDPLAGIEALLREGRSAEAQAEAKQAERTYQQRGDRLREAVSVFFLAAADLHAGDITAVETNLARAAEIAKPFGAVFGDEVAILRGFLRWRQGRLDEAREIFRAVLDRQRLSPRRELELLGHIIEIEAISGRSEEAMALYDRALALARRLDLPAKESLLQCVLLRLRARMLEQDGRFSAAEEILTQAIEYARQADSAVQQARIERELGELAAQTQRNEKAAAHFEAAIRLFQKNRDPYEEALTWRQLSGLYSRFDSRASADALEKARELFTKSGSRLAQAETDLAETVNRFSVGQGDIGEVKNRLLTVLEIRANQKTQREQEIHELLDTIDGYKKIFAEPAASTIVVDGDPAETEGVKTLQQIVRFYTFFQQGEWVAAREVLQTALPEASSGESEAYLLALLGLTYTAESNLNEAFHYLARAVANIEQAAEGVQREEFLAGLLGGKQEFFASLIELLLLQGRSVEAFNYTERARARAFLLGLGNARIEPRGGADAKLVAEAEEVRKQILDLERRAVSASTTDLEQVSSNLRQARERFQSLLVRLKVTNPSYSSRTKVEPLQLQAVQAELAPGTTMISYYVSGFQVHAWVLDKEVFHHFTLPFRPEGLREDLRGTVCWADEIGHRAGGRGVKSINPGCAGKAARAEDLYTKLIAPLAAHIRHRRLVLVPHDVLHYLPFAALRNPTTGRFLIEDYTLAYVPSASVIGFLRSKETPVEGRTLVLGAPEELDPSLEALPAARQEAEVVGRLFGTRPLLGSEAVEERLYEVSGKVDLLHIAAHGVYEPRNSQFSRIVLTPNKEHDGNLETHEITSDIDLSGVNLVVLSACESARGERSGGDEITGLTRAFLNAGSPAVISTLWKIDDGASAALIEQFYHRLLAGASAAEALRQAQLSLLHDPRYSDPYYWAAFSLTGDPQGRWQRPADQRRQKGQ